MDSIIIDYAFLNKKIEIKNSNLPQFKRSFSTKTIKYSSRKSLA
jgi:hypothetical protein